MDADTAMQLMAEMLFAAVKVSLPFLLAALAVGLAVSILQVVTQIQEMTLTFVPKLIVVVVVCLMLGGWMLSVMVELTRRMFETAAAF